MIHAPIADLRPNRMGNVSTNLHDENLARVRADIENASRIQA